MRTVGVTDESVGTELCRSSAALGMPRCPAWSGLAVARSGVAATWPWATMELRERLCRGAVCTAVGWLASPCGREPEGAVRTWWRPAAKCCAVSASDATGWVWGVPWGRRCTGGKGESSSSSMSTLSPNRGGRLRLCLLCADALVPAS